MVAITVITGSGFFPSFYNKFVAKSGLKSAAKEVYGLVLQAKPEPTIRSSSIFHSTQTADTSWCIDFINTTDGDCTKGSSSLLPVPNTSEFQVVNGFEFSDPTITENFADMGTKSNFPGSSLNQAGALSGVPGSGSLVADYSQLFFGNNKNV